MSISFFWLERGGGWGSSPLTSLADHQKLNIIHKQAFHFFGWRGVEMGFKSINQPSWLSEVECNPKNEYFIFCLGRGGRWDSSPSTSPANHQKLNVIKNEHFIFFGWRGVADGVWVHWPARLIIRSECNPKMSFSFFWLERGDGWGLSPLTSLADHQKLNIIQKQAFHFLAGEGWQMGFESTNQPGWLSEVNVTINEHFIFWLKRGDGWGLSPLTS